MTKILNTIKSYRFRYFNIRLVIWVMLLTILGINVIASATDSDIYEKKQVLGFILGLSSARSSDLSAVSRFMASSRQAIPIPARPPRRGSERVSS